VLEGRRRAAAFGLAAYEGAEMRPVKSLAHVRNPILALPGLARLQALPPASRDALSILLHDLAADARVRAEHSWRRHKAPMAAYWNAVAVYSRHIARAIR
jgi:hypothetical protein